MSRARLGTWKAPCRRCGLGVGQADGRRFGDRWLCVTCWRVELHQWYEKTGKEVKKTADPAQPPEV